MSKSSFFSNYSFKLLTNFFTLVIGFLTTSIVPRTLGAADYGKFSFITDVLTKSYVFFDLRSSTHFYITISKKDTKGSYLYFYIAYSLILSFLFLVFVALLAFSPLKQLFFQDVEVKIIFFGCAYVLLFWFQDILTKVFDAKGRTNTIEKYKMFGKVTGAIFLILLFISHNLNLTTYFFYAYLSILISFSVLFQFRLRLIFNFSIREVVFYFKKQWIFIKPLFIYLLVVTSIAILDRWYLQNQSGNIQQGYYGFAFLISNIIMLFLTALLPLFTRDISLHSHSKLKMRFLYLSFLPLSLSFISIICCFSFVMSEEIIFIFAGSDYLPAIAVVKAMFLYPLISTFSNLSGTVIYASNRTKIFRNLMFFLGPLSLFLLFFLLNIERGWGLGALGLGIKILLVEGISVVVILFLNSKYLKFSFLNSTIRFILIPIIIISVAFFVKWLVIFSLPNSTVYVRFFLIGILFLIFIIIIIFKFSDFFGLRKPWKALIYSKTANLNKIIKG